MRGRFQRPLLLTCHLLDIEIGYPLDSRFHSLPIVAAVTLQDSGEKIPAMGPKPSHRQFHFCTFNIDQHSLLYSDAGNIRLC